MKTLREYADEMGESFLKWSRAKERGDETAMQAAMDEGKELCVEAMMAGFSLDDLMHVHKADKLKLCLIRTAERAQNHVNQ